MLVLVGQQSLCQTFHNTCASDHEITIFVHGIMSIKPHLSVSNLVRFMQDNVRDTVYEKTVELMREDTFFQKNQTMQGLGLQKVDIHNLKRGKATGAIAHMYDQVLSMSGNCAAHRHYYTFGWSALMSPSERYADAKIFFEQLLDELSRFWAKKIFPKVRIIGYSHGGNICLNLAAVYRDFYPDSSMIIDELILVGVPVQTETDFLVTSKLFKKIYNFYSDADRIQPIDFFSVNRLFSRRTFKNRKRLKVPSNMLQINFKITRARKNKRGDTVKRRKCATDFENQMIISGSSRHFRDVSPGHIELWFLGWTPQNYRSTFIMHPLPVFIFIPYILSCVKNSGLTFSSLRPVVVDIRPEYEYMVIKQYKPKKQWHVCPFISSEQIERLMHIAHSIWPEEYNRQIYKQHIEDAYQEAVTFYSQNDD